MEPKEQWEGIDFQKYWLVLKRRWLPAVQVFGIALVLTSVYAKTQKSVYEAEAKLLFTTNRASEFTGLPADIAQQFGQLEAISSRDHPLDTQAEIIRSYEVIDQTIRALSLRNENGELLPPEAVGHRVKIKGILGTDVLRVSYQADDPDQAAAVVNKIIEVYMEHNVRTNRAEAASAREFIEQQLPRTEATVQAAESALREFKETNNIIGLQREAEAAIEIIGSLEGEIAQARAELADVTARSQELQNRIGIDANQAIRFTALSQTPGVQEVLTQLQASQQELEVQRTRYSSQHPEIANLERRVAALNVLLQERINQVVGSPQSVPVGNLQVGDLQQRLITDLVQTETQRRGLVQRIGTLTSDQSSYKQRASVLPRLEQRQRELERRLNAAQTTYETLLRRLQEIQVAENQNVGNARVISPARGGRFVGPYTKRIILVGGVLGTLLAISTAFALDLIDQSIKTTQEAKRFFGYSLLGLIPSYGKHGKRLLQFKDEKPSSQVFVKDSPSSPIAQSYRLLQANLKFLGSHKNLKTIVITSSIAQEGKSEVSANLAAAMARMGRRTLLVDTNMHQPMQHRIWKLHNRVGLSNVLVDQVLLEEAVQEVAPNLHVLPSGGEMFLDPQALLDSNQMVALITMASQKYEFVIFDTPMLLGLADAAVLGKMTDGVLLVVRPEVLDMASAKAAKEFLKQSNQVVLGMVLNGVDIRAEPGGQYYTKHQLENVVFQKADIPSKISLKG